MNKQAKETPPQRILAAAMDVFAAEGFAGATMEAIAKKAGVNKAAIYYHVGGKAELYDTVLRSFFGNTADTLEKTLAAAGSPAEGVSILIGAMASQFRDNPNLPRIMMHEWARYGASLTEGVLKELGRIVHCTKGLVDRGVAEGVFRPVPVWPLHLSIIGPLLVFSVTREVRSRVSSLPMAADLRLIMSFEEMARALSDMVIAALAAKPGCPGDKGALKSES